MSALVVTPARVRWEDIGAGSYDAYRRRRRRAERAAQAASLTINLRGATAWYQITRVRACEHPEQGVQRYSEGELSFCTCTACGSTWKEAPLVVS